MPTKRGVSKRQKVSEIRRKDDPRLTNLDQVVRAVLYRVERGITDANKIAESLLPEYDGLMPSRSAPERTGDDDNPDAMTYHVDRYCCITTVNGAEWAIPGDVVMDYPGGKRVLLHEIDYTNTVLGNMDEWQMIEDSPGDARPLWESWRHLQQPSQQ